MDGVLVDSHYQTVSAVSEVLDAVINDGAITTARVPFRPYTMAVPVHVAKKFLGNALKVLPRRPVPLPQEIEHGQRARGQQSGVDR